MFLEILVIGDKEHGRARCVDWMEEFPNIEEFDLVIIAMGTLTQDIFDRIPNKPASISREIGTVWTNGRSVWCIMEDVLTPSRLAGSPKARPHPTPSNYDWLPVPVVVDKVKPGSTVQVVDSMAAEKLRPYLEKVKRWDLEISPAPGMPQGHVLLAPIATNKSNKMISAALVWFPSVGSQIALLPKPTTCDIHEAIELLIDIATGEDRLEPEWRGEIEIPGIMEIDAEVRKLEQEIAFTQKQIEELKVKHLELEKYRDVFSVHEDPQIEAVRRILHDMDIETERTPPRFVVDLLGKEVAVEVTSVADKIGADSDSIGQLVRFKQEHRKNEKLVLVANTHKRENPRVRKGKMDFTPEALSMLKGNGICAVTSAILLGIWMLAKEDKTKARKRILEETGEVRVSSR